MKFASFCNHIIAGAFYSLFFFVPLVFAGDTSELFEFNKMWLTFSITIVIGLVWGLKMIFERRIFVQRTLLDIPLLLFLLSQLIATIFSLDRHVSFWGYYSRFNGGFLSTFTYVFLYYAFVSNLRKKQVLNILQISLLSGVFVALWGLPAHFGYDPTCYVFRGNLDVSCWTDAFQPKVRIFSTLGQPDWMAAYLALLIPLAIAFGINAVKPLGLFQEKNLGSQTKLLSSKIKNQGKMKHFFLTGYYFIITLLFYIDLLFTRARSGFIAIWLALLCFIISYVWMERKIWFKQQPKKFIMHYWYILVVLVCISSSTFFLGTSIAQLDKFTYSGLLQTVTKHQTSTRPSSNQAANTSLPAGELGGTDSGKIRLYVWQGALEAWLHHPLFGTGVETFAFAYYQFRPAGHNLTSEWDYLYNKAHNEYLNYLATTGIFGLGTYLAIIGIFFYVGLKSVKRYSANQQTIPTMQHAKQTHEIPDTQFFILYLALIASFISIMVSNFFGFSVVIINLYFFLIPAFVIITAHAFSPKKIFAFPKTTREDAKKTAASPWQLLGICILFIISGYLLFTLLTYWTADKSYAYGSNLDHAGYYQQANAYLRSAVEVKPQEPVYADELSINDAVLSSAYMQKDATAAAQLAQEAVQLSNQTIQNHPNNVVYWKTRVRLFYSLSQINPQYLSYALQAIQKASQLAPTDAKIAYNLGLLYSQTGDVQDGIQTMQNTIRLKSDYRDAYYALGLFYHQSAIDKNGNVVNKDMEQKAVATMHFILNNFNKDDKQVLDALKNWGEQ